VVKSQRTSGRTRHGSGVSAHLYLSWLHPEKIAKVTVVGEERMLSYEGRFEKRGITVYEYALDRRAPAGDGAPIVPVSHFAGRPLEVPAGREPLALAHFVDSLRGGAEPLTSRRRSLRVVEVLEAAERGAIRDDRAA
jgi:UDP-2-acetamido-3-amino-2,3-dideoxy-glucuronate N-acetyltransferase